MSRRRPVEETGGDEYGPVTDLVFSLFAVSILLLGILGTDGRVRRQALEDALAHRIATPASSAAPAPAVPALLPAAPDPALLADLRRALAEEQARGRSAEAALAEAEERLRRVVEPPYRRLELARLPLGVSASGSPGAASVDADLLDAVRLALGEGLGAIGDIEANRLSIEIDVAARLPATKAGEDPDYRASQDVASALTRALQATALPFDCFVAVPFGKTRAGTVAGLARGGPGKGGDRLADFDAIGQAPGLAATREAVARARRRDDRLTLVAERVANSPCDPSGLRQGIAGWVGAP